MSQPAPPPGPAAPGPGTQGTPPGPGSNPGPGGSGPNGTLAALDPRVAGALAGLVTAVMIASTILGFALSGVLFFFAALPIFFVGHSHGSVAAIVAGAVAAIAVGAFQTLTGALFAAVSVSIPAAYAAWLLNLARPASELGGPEDGLAWFPLADILLRMCLAVAAGAVALGIAIGYDAGALRGAIDAALLEVGQSNPDQFGGLLGADERGEMAGLVAGMLPVFQPAIAVLTLVTNLYLAGRIARGSGLGRRPRDDMPLALRLPILGLLLFGIALALAFLDGPVGLVARCFAGALGMGFTIAGFAVLHHRSRGMGGARVALLLAVYLGTLIFAVPALAMLALGLFSTARAVPISRKE